MARLLDPKKNGVFPFEYRNSSSTDLKETFEKARRKQKEEAAWRLKNAIELRRKTK